MAEDPSLRRPGCLAALALALVLVVASAALLVWALDTDAVRSEAEARLSTLLGQPVAIGAMRLSLLPRPAVTGSAVRVGNEERVAPAVELDSIRIVPRLGPLLRGALVVESVLLEGLVVAVLRDEEGRWQVPVGVPVEPPGREPRVAVERVRLRDGRVDVFEPVAAGGLRRVAGLEDLEGELIGEPGVTRLTSMSGRVGRARLAGGAVIEPAGATIDLQLEGIHTQDVGAILGLLGAGAPDALELGAPASAEVSLRTGPGLQTLSGEGSITAPDVRLDGLRLEGLDARLAIAERRLVLDPARFAVHGGSHDGAITIDLAEAPARWRLDSTTEGLDVGALLTALTGAPQRLDGLGTVVADVGGLVGEPLEAVTGRVGLTIVDGVVRDFPLLATLTRALDLAGTEGRDTTFERLTATVAIGGGAARTDDLQLDAREVRIEAAGRLEFAGPLDFSGLAIFSEGRSREMVRSVRELEVMQNARGELEVPLTVSGTTADPSVAFDLSPVLGRAIEDELRRRLRRLLPGR